MQLHLGQLYDVMFIDRLFVPEVTRILYQFSLMQYVKIEEGKGTRAVIWLEYHWLVDHVSTHLNDNRIPFTKDQVRKK